jgi:hypothetical protein
MAEPSGVSVSDEKLLPQQVRATCPVCGWVSTWSPLHDQPNPLWFARRVAGIEFKIHFDDSHIPQPLWEEK